MYNKTLLAVLFTSTCLTPVWAASLNEHVEVFGEIAAIYGKRSTDNRAEDGTIQKAKADGLAAKKINLGGIFKPSPQFDATVSVLYEEEIDEVITKPEFDQAFVTWHALPEGKLDVAAGYQYLPFGKYATAMVHDPLTLELGEGWREQTLVVSSKQGNLTAHGFAFAPEATYPNGSKHDAGYGVGVNYATETVDMGMEYLSNLTESGGFKELNNAAEAVPGIAIHGNVKLGRVTLLAEHVTATKDFQAGDLANDAGGLEGKAKPAASHVEANLDLGNDRTLAVAWNDTQEASHLGLPQRQYGATYSQPLGKALRGAVELLESKDEDGLKSKAATVQVAYEF